MGCVNEDVSVAHRGRVWCCCCCCSRCSCCSKNSHCGCCVACCYVGGSSAGRSQPSTTPAKAPASQTVEVLLGEPLNQATRVEVQPSRGPHAALQGLPGHRPVMGPLALPKLCLIATHGESTLQELEPWIQDERARLRGNVCEKLTCSVKLRCKPLVGSECRSRYASTQCQKATTGKELWHIVCGGAWRIGRGEVASVHLMMM